jgi:endonuclease YncB( thermonuclease family)
MPDRKLAPTNYRKLVADIVRIYDGARRSMVEAHWEIGKRIVEIEQDGASHAAYGSGLLAQLSSDLTRERGQGFSETNLRRFRRFYLAQKQPRVAELGWSQHNELLAVRDPGKRRSLEKRAVREGLSRDEVRQLVRAIREKRKLSQPRPVNVTPLVPKKGPLNVYQIRSGKDIGWPDPDVLLLDHGFRFYRALNSEASPGLKSGEIVELRGGRLQQTAASKPGYTYTAYLSKLIDGDTLWASLDAGLEEIPHLKLRLRGIDCPEIKTPEGQAAKKFVESVLEGVSSLTVFSYKNDNHDRFEADVFFTDRSGNELYLNNLLLEKGHAVRMDS